MSSDDSRQPTTPAPEAQSTTSASDAAMEMANSVESMSDDQLRALLEESRIVIRPGGEVVIENLTTNLLDVAYELDPDNPGIQCRVDAVAAASEEDEAEGDDDDDERREDGR